MKVTPTKGLFINLHTLLVVFATATVGFAQTGQLSLQNCEAIAANRIEFEVYYKNTSANPVQYNSNVIRINYNAAIMPATGQFTTLAWGYVGGSAFPNSWPPVNSPTFTVSNGTNPRFLTTSTGTGIYLNGTGCAAPTIPVGDSVKLGRFFFQINGGTFVSGQATGLAFNTGANVVGYINCASVSSSFMPSKTSYCSLTIPSACSVNATTSSTPASCSGSSDGSASVTATGSSPFTYLWSNGETTSSISGLAPGQYSVTVTATGGCTTTSSVTVGSNGTTTSNTTSDSACDSYTWAVNGQTYTQSGSYTSINGCATEILSLTVTPSTSSTTTETAVGSYTWSVNGQTYTQSGFYTSVNGCATDTLNLTISGCTQTPQPTIACYETATWDSVNCQWNITGTQPTQPTLACYETATFNSNTCQWDVTGTQPTQPTLACYETATFNTTTCQWDVTGTQPAQPSIACYETATFNNNTCQWDVTGTQPTQPTIACYETATFNSNTCQWDVTGTQPTQPSIACYETATFNSNTCQWDVTGTQPTQPSIACYETATFNSNTCQWDVTGTQPTQPSIACYETATFNSNTCQWDVTGTQPTQPSIACYETTTFNSNTCQWDVTGTQPTQPTTACYETATFNNTTCQWDVTGTPNPPVVTTTSACSSYVWSADGQTYTASGTYNYSANCQDYELNLTITPLVSYYVDADGDGYGAGAATTSCTPLSGYVANNTDCNDNSSTVYPSATETCNGIDDDCNSWVDDGTAGPISGNGIRCVPASSGTATFSVQTVQGTTYAWTVPTGLSIVSGQGTNSIVVSWTNSAIQAGITGSISVVPTNLSGTVSPSCISIDINYAKPVTPGSISSPNKVCPGDVINLSTTSVTRASGYAWTLPTAMRMLSVSTGNVVSVGVDPGFTGGDVIVTAVNACGASPARTRTIGLNIPLTSTSISGMSTGLCGAIGAQFTAATVSNANSYNWNVPAGATITAGQGSSTVTVDFTGAFTGGNITVQAVNSCGNGGTRSLSLSGAPGLAGAISGDQTVCPLQAGVAYSVNTVSGANSYNWTVPTSTTITSGQGTKNILVTWGSNQGTGQQISLVTTNACGSSPAKYLSGISVAFTNCYRIENASNGTLSLNVYPNPAVDFVRLNFLSPVAGKASVSLLDLAGKSVMNTEYMAKEGENALDIYTEGISSGVYMIVIEMEGIRAQTRLTVQ